MIKALELISDTEKVLTSMFGKQVTISISFQEIKPDYQFEKPDRRSLESVLVELCEKEFNIENIRRKNKNEFYVTARFCYYYIAYKTLSLSYSSIGKIIGMDHSTIMNGISKCTDLMNKSPGYKSRVMNVQERLNTYL